MTSPCPNAAGKNFGHGGFFGIEHAGAAGELKAFLAADFADGAGGGEVAVKDDEVAVLFDRVIEGANDFLAGGIIGRVTEILREGLAGDGEAIAVEQTTIEQAFHEGHQAADFDQFGHDETSARFEIAEDGNALADFREVVDGKFHPGGAGHGEEMEDRVGGAAERGDDRDRVFERFTRHDIARANSFFEEIEGGRAGAMAIFHFVLGDGGLGGAVGETHAERFDGAGHGVGGVHAAAGTGAGDGAAFDFGEIGVVHFAVGMFADRFEDGNDVNILIAETAGENRAAINENAGTIEAGHGDDAAGHVFIAAADRDDAVEPFAAHDRFDGVGDHFAGDEGIFHPFGAHGDAVGNGDGVENDGFAARFVRAMSGFDGELIDVHVARGDHAPGGGDADEGLFEIGDVETDRVKHGATGGAVWSIQDEGGMDAVERFGRLVDLGGGLQGLRWLGGLRGILHRAGIFLQTELDGKEESEGETTRMWDE